MIRFFRNIRRKLAAENKVVSYLRYAIGEIVLVVFGILIALQVNNWNENRKDKNKETLYLTNIREEIMGDSLYYERGWFKSYPRKLEGLLNAKNYVMGNYKIKDTIAFLNSASYGGKYSIGNFGINSRTYEELISTGNLSLISDPDLKNRIVSYYLSANFINNYSYDLRSGYAAYFNSFKVFNPKEPTYINKLEIPRILKKLQSDAFYNIVNKELTYTYSINGVLEAQKSRANQLSKVIEQYLKSK